MTDKHPITPPEELVEQWYNECHKQSEPFTLYMTTQAARWGADQELEACCKYMQHEDFHGFATELRTARRPKPLSETDQALETLSWIESEASYDKPMFDTIRRALQRLKKLEALPND
jgi:1,4-alpha-glucan branching enzyme